jgi:hypothetical protein
MQHLDEGTIHSWLDGALSADEAARVEAHAKECPQCAAAVAEARGFIAASSRILTSLDNVPKGVVPIAQHTRATNWTVWRAAAAVLVVALGSFVVLRDRVAEPERSSSAKTIARDQAITSGASAAPLAGTAEQPAADVSVRNAAPIRRLERPQESVVEQAPRPIDRSAPLPKQEAPAAVAPQFRKASPAPTNARGYIRDNVAASVVAGGASGAAPVRSALSAQAPDIASVNTANEPQLIKVVGRRRAIGETQTLYEVAPGDTVVLAEVSSLKLEDVVATGITATSARADTSLSTQSRRQPQAKASAPADNQRKPEPTPSAPPALIAAQSAQASNGITTITWPDPGTGSTMRLSGRHSRGELLEIKRRIEQERAVEAAKKKP